MGYPSVLRAAVGDLPAVWRDLGFDLDQQSAVVGGVAFDCVGAGGGLLAWTLGGVTADEDIDGVPTVVVDEEPPISGVHPNGIDAVDHVVVRTPDLDRTVDALVTAGFDLRRVGGRGPMRQAFFRPAGTIIEVVGPETPEPGDEPASLWGVTFTSPNLDATCAFLGDRISEAKEAFQPGRRIATVRREAGSGVAIAVMSPHVRPAS